MLVALRVYWGKFASWLRTCRNLGKRRRSKSSMTGLYPACSSYTSRWISALGRCSRSTPHLQQCFGGSIHGLILELTAKGFPPLIPLVCQALLRFLWVIESKAQSEQYAMFQAYRSPTQIPQQYGGESGLSLSNARGIQAPYILLICWWLANFILKLELD